MTEQQTQTLLLDLQRKVNHLESKLRTVEDMLRHIDAVTVGTANIVRDLKKR